MCRWPDERERYAEQAKKKYCLQRKWHDNLEKVQDMNNKGLNEKPDQLLQDWMELLARSEKKVVGREEKCW